MTLSINIGAIKLVITHAIAVHGRASDFSPNPAQSRAS